MSTNDFEYYQQRAATERELAQSSERQDVAEIHEELASQYQSLVDSAELRSSHRIVRPAVIQVWGTPKGSHPAGHISDAA